MRDRDAKLPAAAQPARATLPRRPIAHALRVGARCATGTLALSLPQGVLALPIAVAEIGLVPGLLTILLLGALNTLTARWTAQAIADYYARHGAVPSLPQLARARLGRPGELLALGSGATLFFLALVASTVGLARSLSDLSGAPATLCGAACSLVLLALPLGRAALSTGLLLRLGLLNAGLILLLAVLALPHAHFTAGGPPRAGSTLTIVGVTMMLFFAPMLMPAVGQQVLPEGHAPRLFVRGSAAGVAASAILWAGWAAIVCCAAGAAGMAGQLGTAIPALLSAAPATYLPGMLLAPLLLGMTALRCTGILQSLAGEQLPQAISGPWRSLIARLPAGLGMAIALLLLSTGATSFTQLVAIAGVGAAALASLALPALLRASGDRQLRRPAAGVRSREPGGKRLRSF